MRTLILTLNSIHTFLTYASPQLFTSVVLHEWWHSQQQAGNALFTFINGTSMRLPKCVGKNFLEGDAATAAKHILQLCGAPTS
jgi:hypothetical protein